ncbi:MAG: hypothetical protein H7Z21_16190 [Hymenobacter sp.]|nr:hypothetical protein [Hymenobacter sp.]
MAPDNSEILALLADLLRATDRQTETNTRKTDEPRAEMRISANDIREIMTQNMGGLRTELRQTAQETNARFEAILDRFATAVADGFIRNEKKLDEVKQEVAGVKQEVQQIDRRLGRIEQDLPNYLDVVRRLTVLETIVLNKAS